MLGSGFRLAVLVDSGCELGGIGETPSVLAPSERGVELDVEICFLLLTSAAEIKASMNNDALASLFVSGFWDGAGANGLGGFPGDMPPPPRMEFNMSAILPPMTWTGITLISEIGFPSAVDLGRRRSSSSSASSPSSSAVSSLSWVAREGGGRYAS